MTCQRRLRKICSIKTDLFAFFVYKALEFLKPGGRLGFVTSASWLTSESGATMQTVLLERFRPIAVIASDVEAFFAHAEINTVLLVVERVSDEQRRSRDAQVAFVTLKRPMAEILGSRTNYWQGVQDFVDKIETAEQSLEDSDVRVHIERIRNDAEGNWVRLLRAPLSYFSVFGES